MKHTKVGPARRDTNARLGVERKKTDAELAARVAVADREADEVVRAARTRAEEVLRSGRGQADERSRSGTLSGAERMAIEQERARDDETLRQEYARADEITTGERAARARIVASLLDRERRDTDAGLLLERVTADEVLRQREHFLGMVSHDLRNELAGIAMSVAQIVKNASHDDAGGKIFRSATNVQRITLRMSRLIGDLLDVASIEAGRFMIAPEDHDVARVVEDVIESFQSIASAKEISLVGETATEFARATFDHQRILQVLGNLLTNALRLTPQGGRVSVRVERRRRDDGNEAWFSVSDTGPGIAPDRLEAIFERYQQDAHADRKGLGLGLYIARKIVEAHGGRIWAESSGSGSTFHFTLPDRPNTAPSRDHS
ncbi:MAG TPA: ATP-binding protein [Gemmatimonadaceae bacterium]|jgi:signal transduction histidine kinase